MPRPLLSKVVLFVSLTAATGLALAAGCVASPPVEPCHLGSECESGICDDGACVPATSSTKTSSTGGGEGGGGAGSASSTTGASMSTTGTMSSSSSGGGTCTPNHDGTITSAEVPLVAGVSAKFLAATDATFATMGTDAGGGKRKWDLSQTFSGDHLSLVEAQAIAGQWYAGEFAGASYAAKLSETNDLLGVFEIAGENLLLRGVVSPSDGLQKTELTYDPPVVVLAFPLTKNKTWNTDSTVTGYAQGILVTYTEDFTNVVDQEGTLVTPFGSFDVLRVRTTLDRTQGFLTTKIRSFSFTTECFGTVASLFAQDNEPNVEFSDVAELRRLTP
ncbi:MAG: hypothetical protein U0414_08280 [Polyangiaceae bacterium]